MSSYIVWGVGNETPLLIYKIPDLAHSASCLNR